MCKENKNHCLIENRRPNLAKKYIFSFCFVCKQHKHEANSAAVRNPPAPPTDGWEKGFKKGNGGKTGDLFENACQ